MRGVAKHAGCQWLASCTSLLLLIVLQAESISTGTHETHQCNVPLYISLEGAAGGSAEYNFLFQVMMSRIYNKCRCNIRVADRWDLYRPDALEAALASDKMILAVSSEFLLSDWEVSVMRNDSRGQRIILLNLGDETLLHTDEATFGGVLQTMRSYYHEQLTEASLDYLTAKRPSLLGPHVLWVPLGTSKLVSLPDAVRVQRFSERPMLWSWAGSLRSERYDMVRALEESPRAGELLSLGKLVKFDKFAGNDEASEGSLSKWEYSITMHRTQFMPLPSGISPEQYRLWELLEAGCVPIVLEEVVQPGRQLYPLKYLGFQIITIPTWQALPSMLWQLHEDLAARHLHYDHMSQQNQQVWEAVKGRIASHVADLVCSGPAPESSGPHGIDDAV